MNVMNKSNPDPSNESRKSYIRNNKSDIFNSTVINNNTIKSRGNTNSEFVPKYKVESAVSRKMKEFYNVRDNSNKSTCHGKLNQDLLIVPVKHIDIVETPKVRRIKEMYLSHDKSNSGSHSICLTTPHKVAKDEVCDKKIDVTTKNSLVNRVESMKSNIFHSEMKNKENTNFSVVNSNPKTNNEKKDNPVSQNKIKNKTLVSTVFDWTSTNTELVFKKKQLSGYNSESYTPAKMKMKNLVSEMDEPSLKNYQSKLTTARDEIESHRKEIREIMKEKYGTNNPRMQRNIESISNMNNCQSYIRDLKINKKDRQSESYSIENINNFDSLNVNKIKSLYAKNGIHIYDLNLNGNPYGGDKTGSLSFKIRKNDDVNNFENKMNTVKESLMKETGSEVKSKLFSTMKPKTDLKSYNANRNNMNMNDKELDNNALTSSSNAFKTCSKHPSNNESNNSKTQRKNMNKVKSKISEKN